MTGVWPIDVRAFVRHLRATEGAMAEQWCKRASQASRCQSTTLVRDLRQVAYHE